MSAGHPFSQNGRSLKIGVLFRIGRLFGLVQPGPSGSPLVNTDEHVVTISSIFNERMVHKNNNENENFIALNYSWFIRTI